MQAKWWIQFSIQAVLFLFGVGGIFVPQVDTWLYTAIIWGIALTWAIVTVILWRKSKRTIFKADSNAKNSGLNAIVLALEKMDSLLREQALKEAKKQYDMGKYIQVHNRINAEIFGIKPQTADTPEAARRIIQSKQAEFVQRYGNKGKVEWLEKADIISGVLDASGFGLKQYRDRGQYKKLMQLLTTNRNYVIDEVLNKQIREHITSSETLNNMLLDKERAIAIKADYQARQYGVTDFIHSVLVDATSKFEGDARERMITARTIIGKRINTLEGNDGKPSNL